MEKVECLYCDRGAISVLSFDGQEMEWDVCIQCNGRGWLR